MLNLILAPTLPAWLTSAMPVIQIAIVVALAVLALVMIVLVLAQQSSQGGTNVLSGASESFYAQNKGNNREGRLRKIMTVAGVAFFVLVVLYFLSLQVYNG